MDTAVTKIVRFVLRVPDDLHTKLVEISARERRSLNSQILHLLERAVAEDGS